MKKFLFIAVFLIAQTAFCQSYTVKFDKSDFELREKKELTYIHPNKDSYVLLEDTSLPALPYKIVNILLPNDTELEDFTVSLNQTEYKGHVVLEKNPQVVPMSQIGELPERETGKDYKKEMYPENNVIFQNTNIFRGYSYASFLITPFVYNAKLSTLDFVEEFQINIVVKNTHSSIRHHYGEFETIKDLLLNPDEETVLYDANIKSANSVTDTISYLIITSSHLEKTFLPLKAWKTQKGIRTEIINLDDIYSDFSGATIQLKIKNCIKYYYEHHALQWVLLGGDEYNVPVQGCYGNCGLEEDIAIPCDLFYACLDNQFNWDANGNDTIGEPFFDHMDLVPEVYVSRAAVRGRPEAEVFISKTINYELHPALTNYVNRMLLAGTQLWNTWDGISDAQYWSEYIYSNTISPNWNGVRTKFYDTETDYSGGSGYDLTRSNLQSKINLGYHFVHLATHGSYTAWSMETGNNYTTTNAEAQTNSNPAIIITIACNTNAFDQADPCLSEAFLQNSNGGCVVYWGSSRIGLGLKNVNIGAGPSFDFSQGFFYNLFTQTSNSFAQITTKAKEMYLYFLDTYYWLQYSLNAIGDPELPIYTDDPNQFTNVSITTTSNGISVNTGGVSGCRIAVTSNGDFGSSYFKVAENVSQANFSNLPTNYIVTITKKNYVPYRTNPDVYIQNCTISNDAYYYGNNIFAGKHVTTEIPQGNVYFTNDATVILEGENKVYLESDVEIQESVNLKIE